MRLYEMPYFPMDYWSRQISRLLEVSSYLLYGRGELTPDTNMQLNSRIKYCLLCRESCETQPDLLDERCLPELVS